VHFVQKGAQGVVSAFYAAAAGVAAGVAADVSPCAGAISARNAGTCRNRRAAAALAGWS